jgi:hypothetical protein
MLLRAASRPAREEDRYRRRLSTSTLWPMAGGQQAHLRNYPMARGCSDSGAINKAHGADLVSLPQKPEAEKSLPSSLRKPSIESPLCGPRLRSRKDQKQRDRLRDTGNDRGGAKALR